VDVELELVEDVLLVPLVLLVEEVALDESALPTSVGAPGGGPPAGGAPCGDPWGGPAFSTKVANSDFETDPSPSESMALKRSSKDEASVLSVEDVVDDELLAAAWLALARSLFERAPSPSLSRSLSILSAMLLAIFLRNSEKSIELVELPTLETDIGSSLREVKWSVRVSSLHRADFRA
jgi:hypothetical protein